MKLVSWNVNGIRASIKKGFREFVENEQPDVLCLQETKATVDQVDLSWADDFGYTMLWNSATKKGYSGTSIWSKAEQVSHSMGMGLLCLLYTSPSPRDRQKSRMPSSA